MEKWVFTLPGFIGLMTALPISELPAAVRDYVAKQMPGKKIKEAALIVDATGTKKYKAEVGGKDLLFDTAGKPLK